jgi:predicted nucleic acid-binding protein
MANVALVDSSFFIGRFRQRRDPLLELEQRADDWDFATCGMVRLEVGRGFRLPEMLRRYEEAFALMVQVPTSVPVWEQATKLGWELDRKGRRIPAADLVVAACALSVDAVVCALDAHFHAVPGLRVIEGFS